MKYILIFSSLFFLLNCSSQHVQNKNRCNKLYQANFKAIVHEKYNTVNNQDTIAYDEIRFECVFSPFATHKVMFDKFGQWSEEIYPSNSDIPILMWKKIDLLDNGNKFSVLTKGFEDYKYIYASVMVFDENENDMLSDSSTVLVELRKFFSNLIKNHNKDDKAIYETYWKSVDPERWEKLKEYQN